MRAAHLFGSPEYELLLCAELVPSFAPSSGK